MSYKFYTAKTPNFTNRTIKPTSITIHWWGSPIGQKIGSIISWFSQSRSKVSAHYVVTDGIVYEVVPPTKMAWHAGNSLGNNTSIGLELDPNPSMRAGTMRTAAELINNLRGRFGNLPLVPHNRWSKTRCPGDYDLVALDRLARNLGSASGKINVGKAAAGKVTAQVNVPVTTPRRGNPKLTEDGVFGAGSVRVLQTRLGVTVDGAAGPVTIKALQRKLGFKSQDGFLSNQRSANRAAYPGLTNSVLHFSTRGGSSAVYELQKRIGSGVDGVWGHNTSRHLQRKLNNDASFLK